ncbi:hypothetical protein BKP35_14385 [Anaerobacillus arseniciselenatis]|uniref:Uncharacterized protein n=1 Tax=Anaerobacillus arseniciselenatis TaxID=85682 RepID=A0A1S2LCQ8_9BACI|nr:pro-sigmaK processing inhibitor BofA family protein [Anaerobacillus arseniciselenatis]OIJ10282.1 hypothetical protein BKP35_14385 [Anaerobacillus arseniciselenatis]
MIEYILAILAAVLLWTLLVVSPLKLSTKILIKIVFISLLIFVLTNLLHAFYPFYIAITAFTFLLLFFSFVISKQREFSKSQISKTPPPSKNAGKAEDSSVNPPVVEVKPSKEAVGEQAVFGRLDQASIDAILKAEKQKLEEQDVGTKLSCEGAGDDEVVVDVLFSNEENVLNSEALKVSVTNVTNFDQNETELTNEIEDAIEQFLIEHEIESKPRTMNKDETIEKNEVHLSQNNDEITPQESSDDLSTSDEIELYDLGDFSDQDDLANIYEASSRKLSIEEDDHKDDDEIVEEAELIIDDRGLIDEIEEVKKDDEQESLMPDQKVDMKTEHKQKQNPAEDKQSQKESVLKKRTKLFEQLEKDL